MSTYVLGLNNNTAVLLQIRRVVEVLLAVLHRRRTVLPVARVDLQPLLVGAQTHLDARAGRPHLQDFQLRILHRVPWTVEDEGRVVALAASAAEGVLDVFADLLPGLGEVVGGAVGDIDLARRDQDAVSVDHAVRVGHVEGVVQDSDGLLVDESAKVPVDVVREHDRRGLVERDRDDAGDQRRFVGQRVGGDVEHISWETLVRCVV